MPNSNKDNTSVVAAPSNSGEIVLYQPDDKLSLEVKLENESVWLTQQQMADLFGCTSDNVGLHLKNIYAEKELDKISTTEIFSVVRFEGTRKVKRSVTHYNLDAILSVGYRVSSHNATQFRRWATAVLKDYLLKGYNINQRLIYMEERIDRRLNSIESTLADHQEKIDFFVRTNLPPVEQIFYNGQFFEARALLEKLVKSAQKRVIIIDNYIDAATFEILDVRQQGVTADIYSSNLHTNLCNAHNANASVAPINTHIWTTPSHDRWLIVDDDLYHCGHSIKDMGKKLSAIMQMGTSPDTILNAVQ
ncbi:MAG: virulence RhuM family protein [Bacteroidales bacterium]|nr:virulence RhuM family protein [Bacteroidales bacterium]